MIVFVVILVVVLVGGALAFTVARSRRGGLKSAAANRQVLEAQMSVLADDVLQLDAPVTTHPDAKSDYDAAVSRYRAAQAALQYATDDAAVAKVEQMVSDASYSMSRARAIVEGRTPPDPPVAAPPAVAPAAAPAPGGPVVAGPPVVVFGGRRRGRFGPLLGPGRIERRLIRREMRGRRHGW